MPLLVLNPWGSMTLAKLWGNMAMVPEEMGFSRLIRRVRSRLSRLRFQCRPRWACSSSGLEVYNSLELDTEAGAQLTPRER